MSRPSKAEIERRARAEAYAQLPRFCVTGGWPDPSLRLILEEAGIQLIAHDEEESGYVWLNFEEARALRDWLIANLPS